MRRSLLLLAILAIACNDDTRLRPERVSVTRTRTGADAAQLEIEVAIPRGVSFGEAMRPPVLLADKGSFNAISSSLAYGGRTSAIVEAKFVVPYDAQPERLFLGRYDLDFAQGVLLRRN